MVGILALLIPNGTVLTHAHCHRNHWTCRFLRRPSWGGDSRAGNGRNDFYASTQTNMKQTNRHEHTRVGEQYQSTRKSTHITN
mmetsp:Transcript_10555/g.23383  ORF Transcript_10555/g.23383 Transcript_10555/m.23383 type:complete len:83 (+) Transcript_10555:737-985(+)